MSDAPSSGLEMLQKTFAAGGFRRGIGRTLGLSGVSASAGSVVMTGSPTEDHYNPAGKVHGGYLATMLDGAAALALQTMLPTATPYATTDLNVCYLRGVEASSSPLLAQGTVVHLGTTLALCEARLTDREGSLCAHATATFAIRRARVANG